LQNLEADLSALGLAQPEGGGEPAELSHDDHAADPHEKFVETSHGSDADAPLAHANGLFAHAETPAINRFPHLDAGALTGDLEGDVAGALAQVLDGPPELEHGHVPGELPAGAADVLAALDLEISWPPEFSQADHGRALGLAAILSDSLPADDLSAAAQPIV
jgi:hypothetical protein